MRFAALFHCGSPATMTGWAGSTGVVARRSLHNRVTSALNSSRSRKRPGSIAMKGVVRITGWLGSEVASRLTG